MTRACGSCTLCCKLVPVAELGKPGFHRCVHQRMGKGCAIYPKRPLSCRLWNCAWLTDERTAALSRPDRVHYVIDQDLDYITLRDDDTGAIAKQIPVAQVWLDPGFPDAHRDPALRAYLDAVGLTALVRTSSDAAFVLVPPSVNTEGNWIERPTAMMAEQEHSAAEKARVLGEMDIWREQP